MSRDVSWLWVTALILGAFGGLCPGAVPVQPLTAAYTSSGVDFRAAAAGSFPSLTPSPGSASVPLGNEQRIDLGLPEHWRVYAITNDGSFNHAAFALFQTPALTTALPGEPAATNPPSRCSLEPDLDLYVSTDPGMADLEPEAVELSWKSLKRGATESVVLSEPPPGVYYIAVKSETIAPSEFNLFAVFSTSPFAEGDSSGGMGLRGLPLPQPIPDAAASPGVAHVIALGTEALGTVHRVVVIEALQHPDMRELRGTLSHNGVTVGLHAPGFEPPVGEMRWDDSMEEPGIPALQTLGPGSLDQFRGLDAAGVWVFSLADLTNANSGTIETLSLQLEPEGNLASGESHLVHAGGASQHAIEVPLGATNLTVSATVLTEDSGLTMGLRRQGDIPGETLELTDQAGTRSLQVDLYTAPPLRPGSYLLTLTNPCPSPVQAQLTATVLIEEAEVPRMRFNSRAFLPLADAGVTRAHIQVPVPGQLASLSVAARIQHPRLSDLLLTLISPNGTRVELIDHRGGLTTNGLGTDVAITNVTPISSSGGPAASTNVVDVGYGSGTVSIDYSFYAVPDQMRIYRGLTRIFDSGMVNESGSWTLNYGPSEHTNLTVVMNEGDNYDTNTAWFYLITSTRQGVVPALFGDDTLAAPLVKFAPPPFTEISPAVPSTYSNVVALAPEQSLACLAGEPLPGTWTLELLDTVPGPQNGTAVLVCWDLYAAAEPAAPLPMPLSHGSSRTIALTPEREWQHFRVETPAWAQWATNHLLSSTGPLNLWYSTNGMPNEAGGLLLASAVTNATVIRGTASNPQLVPGEVYYFSLQNAGNGSVTAEVRADFDVIQLEAPAEVSVAVPAGSARYFGHLVGEEMAGMQLSLDQLTGDLNLAASPGLPLPTSEESAYFSFNPDLEPEHIQVNTVSDPVPLRAGQWHFAVFNPGATLVSGRLTLIISPAPAVISEVSVLPGGIELKWTGPLGSTFEVQYSDTLDPAAWTPVPTPVTSTTREFRYVDTQHSTGPRFYRVVQLGPFTG